MIMTNRPHSHKSRNHFASMISRAIAQHRRLRGLSQSELARKSGVTSAAISLIEKGYRIPSFPVIFSICEVLGLSLDNLCSSTAEHIQELSEKQKLWVEFRDIPTLCEEDKNLIKELVERLAKGGDDK